MNFTFVLFTRKLLLPVVEIVMYTGTE